MSSDEDDGPPLLVNVEAKDEASVKESSSIKVPITIVTGKLKKHLRMSILY